MNFFKATIDKNQLLNFAGVSMRSPSANGAFTPGSPFNIGIRPEHFGREVKPDASIEVSIDFVEHLGGTSFVHGHLAGGEKVIVEHRTAGELKSGKSMKTGFKIKDIRAFDAGGVRVR